MTDGQTELRWSRRATAVPAVVRKKDHGDFMARSHLRRRCMIGASTPNASWKKLGKIKKSKTGGDFFDSKLHKIRKYA